MTEPARRGRLSRVVSNVTTIEAPVIPDSPQLQIRRHAARNGDVPALLYLPGLHGDWTLLGPFRRAWAERGELLEVSYPQRADWALPDYARAVLNALQETGARRCWLMGESFSSQVAWQIVALAEETGTARALFDGMILVGGFVRHPWPWGVKLARQASSTVPGWVLRRACQLYGWSAKWRARNPEHHAELDEFVARRAAPEDRVALTSRYVLIDQFDPRPIAQTTTLPVYQLAGAWDPIVPWWDVRAWLQRHCPSYVASRILWSSGHNVLLSGPHLCAAQILDWSGAARMNRPSDFEPRLERPV